VILNKDILPKWWSIVIWSVIALTLQGCYTQLAMFYPEPEIERETEEQFYETYSRAVPRLSASIYAQTGAGTPLGLAYTTMYNRFNGFTGFGNRYNYYNPYFYGGYYNETYNLGGYTMRIPYTNLYAPGERKQRTFTTGRDGSSPRTNLMVTRTRSTQSDNNNSDYTNSSNVSSNRSSSTSSSSSSSSESGGRRTTRRN
jgi:hypothetical protein